MGRWHHVLFSYNGEATDVEKAGKLYIDGNSVGVRNIDSGWDMIKDLSGLASYPVGGCNYLSSGSVIECAGDKWKGSIDDFRVFGVFLE